METPTDDGSDRLFLVELGEGLLTIIPLRDVDAYRWPEMEESSKGIFESIQRDPAVKVLVDMGRMATCTSALLGLMIKVWKSVSPQSGVLAFCNVNDDIGHILRQTKLDTLWAIYSSREAAQTALGVSSKSFDSTTVVE